MRELIEYIAKALVDRPDEVRVTQVGGAQAVILELHVAPDDVGKVIGTQGRIATAMRTLLTVVAARAGTRATLDIVRAGEDHGRPVCWLLGHRWETRRTFRGPVRGCSRCGLILATPQR